MMTPCDAYTRIEALVEANDQLYWGRDANEVEKAAQVLRSHHLNPVLADHLLLKAVRMKTRQVSPLQAC